MKPLSIWSMHYALRQFHPKLITADKQGKKSVSRSTKRVAKASSVVYDDAVPSTSKELTEENRQPPSQIPEITVQVDEVLSITPEKNRSPGSHHGSVQSMQSSIMFSCSPGSQNDECWTGLNDKENFIN